MRDRDLDGRVLKIRRCRHNQRHYRDEYGNRHCRDCHAFVRPVAGAVMCAPPKRDGR